MEIEESKTKIEDRIFTIRGKQVMLDRDLAQRYQVEVSQMNRQVKRNIERFPDDFMFQLTKEEHEYLKCQNGISNTHGGDRMRPYAFTEHGISMLAGLLRSAIAIEINIRIIRAFIEFRKMTHSYQYLFERIENIEHRQNEFEHKVENALNRICHQESIPKQGIFFDGQIYDAYAFVAGLIRKAMKRIILIDNYIDETVLTLLDKRTEGVTATICTRMVSKQLQLDIKKHNKQYPPIEVQIFVKAHDRFLVIDEEVSIHQRPR